jgi:Na+/H+ antiporter NhaD/arsenite permease-like protein
MIPCILVCCVIVVFVLMARQCFGPDFGMPLLALLALILSSPEGAISSLKRGFEEFAHIAVTFTAVSMAAHQLLESNLLSSLGMFTGNAVARSAQRIWMPVTWGVAAFCLSTTWLLAATLHNTTAILAATPITLIVCRQFEVNPLPVLYGSLVASNLGGFSTRWGDAPNLIEAAQWGLQHGDFSQIMVINLGCLAMLIGVVAVQMGEITISRPELELILHGFDQARMSHAINWPLALSALGGLLLIIVPPVFWPAQELRFVALGILCLCTGIHFFGVKATREHNPFGALGFETLATLAAVFVLAAVIGSPEMKIAATLREKLVELNAPVWAISIISYLGTLLTEAASWANAAAPIVHSVDPSHRAAWALGAGICAGSSSLVTAASAGILLMKQTERALDGQVTFGGYIKFGLGFSVLMLAYYITVFSAFYRD